MCCSPSWSNNKEAVYGDLVTFSEVKRDAKINRLSDLSGGESTGPK
mgnify:FL=1